MNFKKTNFGRNFPTSNVPWRSVCLTVILTLLSGENSTTIVQFHNAYRMAVESVMFRTDIWYVTCKFSSITEHLYNLEATSTRREGFTAAKVV